MRRALALFLLAILLLVFIAAPTKHSSAQAPTAIQQVEYLAIIFTERSDQEPEGFTIETAAKISDNLRQIIGSYTRQQSPMTIIIPAGYEGWELLPLAIPWLWGPGAHSQIFLLFKRPMGVYPEFVGTFAPPTSQPTATFTQTPTFTPTFTPTPTLTPTITYTPSLTFTPTSTLTPTATIPPLALPTQATRSAIKQEAGDVLAYCSDPKYGAGKNFAAAKPIVIYWGWNARTVEQIQDHIRNAQYEVRLDGALITNWADFRAAIRTSSSPAVYWYVPVGKLSIGQHRIDYKLTWKQAISDGTDKYGPGTPHETEIGSCLFSVS